MPQSYILGREMQRSVHYDPALPVSQKRQEIAQAIRGYPVVIICGETGSGKTTQLPKILLEMGRGGEVSRVTTRATARRPRRWR